MKLPPWLLYTLIITITVVWVANFVAGLLLNEYDPPESINLLFSTTVAALILQKGKQDRNGGEGDGS